MPRRREFKGIAKNLAQWCLCRNNDYLGYWAIGQLYRFSQSKKVSEVTVDVLAMQFSPESKEFISLCNGFREIVKKEMSSKSMPDSWLESLKIKFNFEAAFSVKYHSAISKPMICTVVITTDFGKEYYGESGCNCRLHNPKNEQRRFGF